MKTIFEDNIIYRHNKDHKRYELVCLTDELKEAKRYTDRGWKKRKVLSRIILISPEVGLIDLFNPFEIKENGGFKKHLILYETLKELQKERKLQEIIKKATDKRFIILGGESIEFQVRLALWEKDDSLKDKIKELVKKEQSYLKRIGFEGKEKTMILEKRKIPDEKKYQDLKDLYFIMTDKFALPENIYGFSEELPKADKYVLIPHSGFKFIDEITTKIGKENVLFYEKHFSQDGDFWVNKEDIKGKTIAIFDVAYSGRTLDWVGKIVKKEGGIPIKIAVWVRSSMAVKEADWCMLADKIISTKMIKIKKGWELDIYKKIALNKI